MGLQTKLMALGLFVALAARVAFVHYERYSLVTKLVEKYNSDSSPELNTKDLLRLLKDRGIDLSPEQLKNWVGDVDEEKNGYDAGEIQEVIERFDDMATWKHKDNVDYGSDWTYFGFSAFGDVTLLCMGAMATFYFISHNEALTKQVRTSGVASTLKVAAMKGRWKKVEAEKASAEKGRLDIERSLEELKEKLASNQSTKEDEEALAKLQKDLQAAIEREKSVKEDLKKVRDESEKHLKESNMNNEKLAFTLKMAKNVNAFVGAGAGKYEEKGATKGFGKKMGLQVQKSLFGFPTDDGMRMFEVGNKLGDGTDGAFRCSDVVSKEEYCVKIYRIADERQRASMLRDLQAKQSIGSHPHIVRFEQIIETEDTIYVMMELIHGKDIFDHVVGLGGVKEKDAAIIMYQICDALKFCHDHDIVHGDVKPENAMIISGGDGEPLIKLIDFGFSSFMGSCEGDEKLQSVRDKYAPPEAFDYSQKPDKKGDSFRLGCTLYTMLVCSFPFRTEYCDEARKNGEVIKVGAEKYTALSQGAKDLIDSLLKDRLTMDQVMSHTWFKEQIPHKFAAAGSA